MKSIKPGDTVVRINFDSSLFKVGQTKIVAKIVDRMVYTTDNVGLKYLNSQILRYCIELSDFLANKDKYPEEYQEYLKYHKEPIINNTYPIY